MRNPKPAFVNNGKPVSWEQAMAGFEDGTGKPGPATWELGNYREGTEDLPVGGVSWYEAAAYAAFALPRGMALIASPFSFSARRSS